MLWPDGDRYEGQFFEGVKQGKGTWESANGSYTYVGEWLDEKPHGNGKATLASGASYEGSWFEDSYHGWGTFRWASGKVYIGDH